MGTRAALAALGVLLIGGLVFWMLSGNRGTRTHSSKLTNSTGCDPVAKGSGGPTFAPKRGIGGRGGPPGPIMLGRSPVTANHWDWVISNFDRKNGSPGGGSSPHFASRGTHAGHTCSTLESATGTSTKTMPVIHRMM